MTNEEIKKMWEAYQSVVSEKKSMCEKCGKMHEGECEMDDDEEEIDEGIMDKVKAGIKKVLGKYRLDKSQRKASAELKSYYDDWIASGGSEERFMELVHGTGKQMSLDIEPDEMFKDWLPKVRRANRKDDRLTKLRMKKEDVDLDEAKKLDPVNDKENDKPFAKRKDKDIDNDGDVDSSDEYLHKKRAATDDAIDGGKKPADDEDPKKKKVMNPKTSDKTAEISKIESVSTKEAFDALWNAIEEAVTQKMKKGATPPEGMDDKESPKGKEFKAMHKVNSISHDDFERIEEPKERKVKKEMTEFEVIRALLSGKPTGE